MIESLYRSHFDALRRSAQQLLDTAHAAEEVVQEAFVRLAHLPTRPKTGCELAYLRSIVLNEARSTIRRRQVARRYPFAMLDVATADETGECAVRDAEARTLHHHLAALPLRQRQVVTLRHLKGLSERETAAALAISAGSVKTHSSRAIAAIRQQMSDAS